MRKLAWQKLALLLVCGFIITGCGEDRNSWTEPINWESISSEDLADLDLENRSLDQLLGILNSLSLFPDDIIGVDENCLAQIGDINSFLASNRSVTCELELGNGQEVTVVVNPDLVGIDTIPPKDLQSDPRITFNPPPQTSDNPDPVPPISDPIGDNPDPVPPISDPIVDNPDPVPPISDPIVDNPNSGGGVIIENPGVIITDPPIIIEPPNPDPVDVSESNSIASLGFFSILLFGQGTIKYFRRQDQSKKMPKDSQKDL
jgi:hypothetical protein